MKLLDPQSLGAGIDASEERVNRAFARSVTVIERNSTTYVRCGRTPLASSLVSGFVLLILLSFFACTFWLTNARWLLLPIVFGIVGVPAILSTRESLAVTASGITLQSVLRPLRKAVTIPRGGVTSVRVESFRDSPSDCHVAIVTASRTFRFAEGLSEGAAQEVAQAIRERLWAA